VSDHDVSESEAARSERRELAQKGYVLADGLDDLCAKIGYRKQAVQALLAMVKKWE